MPKSVVVVVFGGHPGGEVPGFGGFLRSHWPIVVLFVPKHEFVVAADGRMALEGHGQLQTA